MEERFDSSMLDFDSDVSQFSDQEQIAVWDTTIADLKADIKEKSKMMLSKRPTFLNDAKLLLQEFSGVNEEIDSISLRLQNDMQPNFEINADALENKYRKAQVLYTVTRCLQIYLKCLSIHQKACVLLKQRKLETVSEFLIKCQREFSYFESQLRDSDLCDEVSKKISEFRLDFAKEILKTFQTFCSFENFIFSLSLPEARSSCLIKIMEITDCSEVVAVVLRKQITSALKYLCNSHKLRFSQQHGSMDLHFEPTSTGMSLKEVLTDVGSLFSCLNATFLCYQCDEISFIHKLYLGENWGDDLVKIIIADILEKRIPKTVKETENYDYDAIRKCEQMLVDLKITEKAKCFEEFYLTLNKKFVQNFICCSLADGRRYILRDLAEISLAYEGKFRMNAEKQSTWTNGNSVPTLNEDNSQFIQRQLDTFPCVHISTGIQSLSSLASHCIEQASQLREVECARDLLQCSLDLVSLYCNVASSLSEMSIPYLCAIQYNNLMYMAHQCMFYGLVPLTFKDEGVLCREVEVLTSTFSHFIPVLRQQAESLFKTAIERQRESLRDILNEATLFPALAPNLLQSGRMEPSQLEKPVEQCFFLIEKLLDTWRPPTMSFNKYKLAMASLLDYILKFVVSYCVRLEDITTNDSQILDLILGKVEEKCHKIVSSIFEQPHVKPDCKSSNKSSENFFRDVLTEFERLQWVKRVLATSLLNLQTEYLSAGSSLRSNISVEEIKSLIRALFQNTEIRSMVISSIK